MISYRLMNITGNMKSFSAMDSKFDYEYLIKYKSMSYLHVQWTTANEIGNLKFLLFYLI
jgi:hypothetical protein